MCIDISLSNDLPGFVRKVIIWKDLQVTIKFDNYGYDEGGIYYVGNFESLDELVENIEVYLEKPISAWENFSQTGNYPERRSEFSISGDTIKEKIRQGNISLPNKGSFFLTSGYWKQFENPEKSENLWLEEVERRIDLIEQGEMKLIAGEEARKRNRETE